MASFDITDFDIYNYDIILRPDGLVQETANDGFANGPKPLKPYYFNTPSNFFAHPNQKCYFLLREAMLGATDSSDIGEEGVQYYLSLGVSSKYAYSNFRASPNGGIVDSMSQTEHTESAKLLTLFNPYYYGDYDEIAGAMLGLGTPVLNRIVCITPPFGQMMNFRFETVDVAPIFSDTNTNIDFDVECRPVKNADAVVLSFSILVQKEPYKIKA